MTAMKTAKDTSRIERLRALAEHPNTPEHERNLAARVLERLVAKLAEQNPTAAASYGGYQMPGRVYGAKYDHDYKLSTTDIAKLIREEIKLARKAAKQSAGEHGSLKVFDPIGDAPTEITFSVRSQYFSGGSSIDIYIKNIPEAWGWTEMLDTWGDMRKYPSDALTALARELRSVLAAYNHDGSDAMVDYWDVRFYCQVMDASGRLLG